MFDRGLFLTGQAIRRQLAAMPNAMYLVRLIHHRTRAAFPGERLWTAGQLAHLATVKFLRVRNREGCDVYVEPWEGTCNPGYLLVDLDQGSLDIVTRMRARGHDPCVVVQTSPGNLQAWVRVSATPIEPAVARHISQQLARLYGGDLASTGWRHLGRLAGFTNQKPQRRNDRGYSPWVQVLHAQACVAPQGAALIDAAGRWVSSHAPPVTASSLHLTLDQDWDDEPAQIYAYWLRRLRIVEHYPQPDWSIADKWVAKELLRHGTPASQAAAILRGGSPGFPRRHADPEDYLRRTLARAASELACSPFPGRDPVRGPAHPPPR